MFTTARIAAATAAAALAAAAATPTAHADVIFIRCQFSVDQPFTYDLGGAKYAGSRMNASNCQTNLPSAPVTLEFHMQVGYGDQNSGATDVFRRDYSAVIDVHDGGSYSVQFPNDDQLIALKPGSYMASGTATSTLEGFEHPKSVTTKIATWGVNWGSLPHMS
ncbi:hypothetical protein AO501_07960 [Mycobacterium gordonae]|uniref:Uncharacterized protein n=1 Tax=Mycobacterium gordonae TaxID=1778 RepID=A0A0Q2ML94_MYCGO|nr:hypothetical protein [Mycobacterium gordonae]KQH80511.1 hypothetical protein AO501_07960 [Mycobacterium gordonae]